MTVALQYPNKKRHVVECFLGIEHVTNTSALSLKAAIEDLFSRHGLSLCGLHGQCYHGARYKNSYMKENECAYILCALFYLSIVIGFCDCGKKS
jgi:hypothetical protein